MFIVHLFYKEGSRPSQVFPFCERDNADTGSSDGQTSPHLTTEQLGRVTCPYCQWEHHKENGGRNIQLPVHWSVHPIFSRDGTTRLVHWEAACGEVNIFPGLIFASRIPDEVDCSECLENLI